MSGGGTFTLPRWDDRRLYVRRRGGKALAQMSPQLIPSTAARPSRSSPKEGTHSQGTLLSPLRITQTRKNSTIDRSPSWRSVPIQMTYERVGDALVTQPCIRSEPFHGNSDRAARISGPAARATYTNGMAYDRAPRWRSVSPRFRETGRAAGVQCRAFSARIVQHE
jgi:hypothetical protein